MGKTTGIDWTDHTFNPWRGCTKISPGCHNCYAEALSRRNPEVLGVWGPLGKRVVAAEAYWRQPLAWNAAAERDGVRRRVFCASLADVFEDRPELVAPRLRLLDTIRVTQSLDWLLLTKRPEIAADWYRRTLWWGGELGGNEHGGLWVDGLTPAPEGLIRRHAPSMFFGIARNVWLGVSVEQRSTLWRVDMLRQIPAAVRFLSVEPLLEHLGPLNLDGIDWVIVGGESGPGARPMSAEWVRSIRNQCKVRGVAFFFKQWSGPRPKSNGKTLDGREWCEFPRQELTPCA